VKAKRIAVNPVKGVENLPRKTAKRRVYLSADNVYRLADESGEHRALARLIGVAATPLGLPCTPCKRSEQQCTESSDRRDGRGPLRGVSPCDVQVPL
jgi:hypothetical protein